MPEWSAKVSFDVKYGKVEVSSRLVCIAGKIVGECRAWHYDGKGELVLDTGWQQTGAEMKL